MTIVVMIIKLSKPINFSVISVCLQQLYNSKLVLFYEIAPRIGIYDQV